MSGYSIDVDELKHHVERVAWYLASGRPGLLILGRDDCGYALDDLPEGREVREMEARFNVARTMLREKHHRERSELQELQEEAIWDLAYSDDIAEAAAKRMAEDAEERKLPPIGPGEATMGPPAVQPAWQRTEPAPGTVCARWSAEGREVPPAGEPA
jgi:hypothetical protein